MRGRTGGWVSVTGSWIGEDEEELARAGIGKELGSGRDLGD